MRAGLNKLKGVLLGTGRDVKLSEKAEPEKEMVKNSTTSGTIVLEVWIMSGLLLSLGQQIVAVNLRQRLVEKPETNTESNNGQE
jgi:hypothetical protein